MLRVGVIWSSSGLGESYSRLHFVGSSGVQAQAAATKVAEFLGQIADRLAPTLTAIVEPEVTVIDEASGDATNAFITTTEQVEGTAGGNRLPDQDQLLVRFATGVFVDGRRFRGRLYIPGLTNTSVVDGGVAPIAAVDVVAAAEGILLPGGTEGTPLVIYRRPGGGPTFPPGFSEEVNAVSVGTEFAVLRSRRQ